MSDLIDCIAAPFRIVWLLLWPILSILLGTIAGTLLSAVATLAVFLITLVRTPMHIFKMLHVTATTKECFAGGMCMPLVMRLAVFLCVPVVHLLFLGLITAFSATIGTMYYIGKSTKVFYKHEYRESLSNIASNARLEEDSWFGEYVQGCQDYMEDDAACKDVIWLIKGLLATIPGMAISAVVFIPYAIAFAAITLYRLPINVYKTMKIALFTVVLKWDLRLVVLLSLPLIHTMFPLVAFLGALVGSFVWTWCQATENIGIGDRPFRKLGKLKDSLRDYLEIHKEFVSKQCDRYDHPSGIPYGWDGMAYGLEIERILKWQRDFLICCVLILIETPVCLAGPLILSTIKYVPTCFYCWNSYFK